MKRFEEKNERLEQISSELLKASVLKDEEIDKIVAAPHLFDSVRAAIRLERKAARPGWDWRKSATIFAAVAVFAIGAFGLINFARQYYVPSEALLNAQNQVEQIIAPQPLQVIQPAIEHYEAQNSNFVKMVARNTHKNKTAIHAIKKERPSGRIEEVSEFYAVTYTGDADESDDDQIVRVELPRSSLFAMGINVPVENEVVKVKADLLIGSDGVMKAVRLVR
jgi:hypothetical protein